MTNGELRQRMEAIVEPLPLPPRAIRRSYGPHPGQQIRARLDYALRTGAITKPEQTDLERRLQEVLDEARGVAVRP